MSSPVSNGNTPLPDLKVKIGVDAYGHQGSFMQSEWKGLTLVHDAAFKECAKTLESLQGYQPHEDDVWICNYAKTGTHWVFEILHMLLSGKDDPVKDMKEIAMIETHPDIAVLDDLPSPRVLNTHIHPKFFPTALFDAKVIVTIRNPLSVELSCYHHWKTLEELDPVPYKGNATQYILSRVYETAPVLDKQNGENLFGSWFTVVPYWWKHFKNHPNVLFLFYEDMRLNPFENVKKISNFLGKSHSDQFLQQVVEMTDISTMKKTTMKKEVPAHLASRNVLGQTNVRAMFYRKGQIDEWKDHIQGEDLKKFQDYYSQRMHDVPDLVDKVKFE